MICINDGFGFGFRAEEMKMEGKLLQLNETARHLLQSRTMRG